MSFLDPASIESMITKVGHEETRGRVLVFRLGTSPSSLQTHVMIGCESELDSISCHSRYIMPVEGRAPIML